MNNNQLSVLDVSNLTNMQSLQLNNNHVAFLDVSNLIHMQSLQLNNNNVAVLDVSNMDEIRFLSCSVNKISELDVAGKSYLTVLDFRLNNLTSIDLTNVGQLSETSGWFVTIDADGNNLTAVDTSVMGQDVRVQLHCDGNPNLESINVMNGVTFFDYIWTEPPLPGPGIYFEGLPNLMHICADAVNFPYLNDKIASYDYTNVTVDSSCMLGIDSLNDNDFVVYPNPAQNQLSIQLKNGVEVKSVSVYNTLGQLVQISKGNIQTLDVSGLTTGNYLLKVESDNGIKTTKFIKQ